MIDNVIELEGLRHLYDDGNRRFLLNVPKLSIQRCGTTSILGPSGCGKTTLQNKAGLLMPPGGREHVAVAHFRVYERANRKNLKSMCHDIAAWSREGKQGRQKIERLRRRMMGFYLQAGELIPTLTIEENVAMPLRLNGWSGRDASRRAKELLAYLLDVRVRDIPNKLALNSSGGEYQRVALGRAIAHKPQIIFVDEPTSSLDPPNKRRVLDLLTQLVADEDSTVVMVTHDVQLARSYSDRIVHFDTPSDGWGDQINIPFRTSDGYGRPANFEMKIENEWVASDCDWTPCNNTILETLDVK